MNKTKIDWPWKPLYTWNPVTGCLRGCSYCYARKMHYRFHPGVPFTDITLHPERLLEPAKRKTPSDIFVGSMSDIAYWSQNQRRCVIDSIEEAKRHTYIFLTKNAQVYKDRVFQHASATIIPGVTVTGNRAEDSYNIVRLSQWSGPAFISVEPLLGPVHIPTDIAWHLEFVIVGAMTGPGAVPVKQEWIDSITATVPAVKIYWKPSMAKHRGQG